MTRTAMDVVRTVKSIVGRAHAQGLTVTRIYMSDKDGKLLKAFATHVCQPVGQNDQKVLGIPFTCSSEHTGIWCKTERKVSHGR